MRCLGCGEEIVGEYIEALGAEWHPGCFTCAACGRELDGGFVERDGKPYHSECYHARFSPRCAGCGKPLSNSYLTALGRAWHPEHFRCERCGKPFVGEFFEHKGKAYCADDYHELFSPRCAVCGAAMRGEYAVNGWGEQYCTRHERDLARCYSCARPISPRLTGGGATYRDGRSQCNICRRTSVDSLAHGEAMLSWVNASLARAGIDLRDASTPLRLSDADELRQKATQAHATDPSGVACTRLWTQNGREVRREVEEIAILHGLPQWHFEAVAAHELGHAWLFLNRFPPLPPPIEEGICELCEYLWLREQDSPEAIWLLKAMDENPDPIYGEGYRAVRQALEGRTLQELMEYIWRQGKLP